MGRDVIGALAQPPGQIVAVTPQPLVEGFDRMRRACIVMVHRLLLDTIYIP
jgi:hypothetical protein